MEKLTQIPGYADYPWPIDTWVQGWMFNQDAVGAKVAIILDFPADFLYNLRTHLTGDERRLLLTCLTNAGIDPLDVYLTYAIPHNVPNREVTKQMIEFNHKRLRQEIKQISPERILVMGSAAYKVWNNSETGDINTIRGRCEYTRISHQFYSLVLYSVPPYFVMSKDDQYRDFAYDLMKFASVTRMHPQSHINQVVVKSPAHLRKALKEIEGASVVSCDIETSPLVHIGGGGGENDALNPYTSLIDAIGFGAINQDLTQTYTVIVPWELIENQEVAETIYHFMFDEADEKGRLKYQCNRLAMGKLQYSDSIPAYDLVNLHEEELREFVPPDSVQRRPIAEGTRVYTDHRRLFVLHNGKFDTQFLTLYFKRYGLIEQRTTCFGLPMRDTMLMNFSLDERPYNYSPSPHSLKAIARERYDMPNYKFNWAEFWSVPREERDYHDMYSYLSDDLMFTLLAYFDILEEILEEDPHLLELVDQVLVPATQAFADMQLQGVYLDRAHLEAAEAELTQEMEKERRLIRDACFEFLVLRISDAAFYKIGKKGSDIVPEDMEEKVVGTVEKLLEAFFEDFNPRSTTQTQWLLYEALGMSKRVWRDSRQGGNEYTTNKVFLQQVKGAHPGTVLASTIDHLIKYRELGTLRSTFIRGLLRRSEGDGKIHGQFNADGASTGRTSSQDPNLQNIPVLHGPLVRRAFTVPSDYTWLSVDYSQLEYRVATEYSNDPDMMQVFLDGRDMHREVAARMFSKPPEEIDDIERFMAKIVGFGSLYGRTPESMAFAPELIGTAWEDDVEACRMFMENMMGGFPGYKNWREMQEESARSLGYVVQPSGRKRRFTFITRRSYNHTMRQAVNTPIQGYASDITVYSLIRIHMRLCGMRSHILSVVHDEINVQAHKDEARRIARMMQWVMENETIHAFRVPIKADVEVGKNWGDLQKWDPFKYPLPEEAIVG